MELADARKSSRISPEHSSNPRARTQTTSTGPQEVVPELSVVIASTRIEILSFTLAFDAGRGRDVFRAHFSQTWKTSAGLIEGMSVAENEHAAALECVVVVTIFSFFFSKLPKI